MRFYFGGPSRAVLAAVVVLPTLATYAIAQAQELAPPNKTSPAKNKAQLHKKAGKLAAPKPESAAKGGELPSNDRTIQGEADVPRGQSKSGGVISKSTIGSDALRRADTQTTYDAIKNVPGVTQADAKSGGVADALQIRGIRLNSQTSYRLDGGMPLETDLFTPVEDKEKVEVLKGASALQYGLASPAGIINYTMKRAGPKPLYSFSTANNEYGQAIGTLDLGRRFGDGDQFGLRTIVSGGYLQSQVYGANGFKGLLGVAGDWQPDERFSLRVDFEEFGADVVEQATVLQNKAVNGFVPLPRQPNPYLLLSGPYSREQGIGQTALVSASYLLDYGFKLIAEAGRADARVLNRRKSQLGAYDIFTGLGTLSTTRIYDQDYVNTYLKGEIKHRVEYGVVTNDLTLGINRNGRDFNNPRTLVFQTSQNLYTPFDPVPAPVPTPQPFFPINTSDLGYYFQEDIGLFDKVHLLGGIRALTYNSRSLSMAGTENRNTSHVLSPGTGFSADIFPFLTTYFSYLQALEETGSAPQNAVNRFQILPPAAATQTEVGLRSNYKGFNGSIAYFVINRGNATTDPNTLIYALNGTTEYRGVEGMANYVFSPEFDFYTGGLILNAHQKSADPTINGRRPENTPKISGNIGFDYNPAFVPGLSINAGALFTGSRELNPQNQGTIPAVTILTVGARYKTKLYGHPVSYNVNCDNLTDLRYFSSAVNNALGIGRPRTITFGARAEF